MPAQSDPTFGAAIERVMADEVATIEAQRKNRGVAANPARRVRLALTGGGIRSASFCAGVLQAVERKKRLVDFDYLSTVSGGGYIGATLRAGAIVGRRLALVKQLSIVLRADTWRGTWE